MLDARSSMRLTTSSMHISIPETAEVASAKKSGPGLRDLQIRLCMATMDLQIDGRSQAVHNARKVLLYFCHRVQVMETGALECWPSVTRTSKDCRIDRKTCRTAIQRLEKHGIISRRMDHIRGRACRVITLTHPDLQGGEVSGDTSPEHSSEKVGKFQGILPQGGGEVSGDTSPGHSGEVSGDTSPGGGEVSGDTSPLKNKEEEIERNLKRNKSTQSNGSSSNMSVVNNNEQAPEPYRQVDWLEYPKIRFEGEIVERKAKGMLWGKDLNWVFYCARDELLRIANRHRMFHHKSLLRIMTEAVSIADHVERSKWQDSDLRGRSLRWCITDAPSSPVGWGCSIDVCDVIDELKELSEETLKGKIIKPAFKTQPRSKGIWKRDIKNAMALAKEVDANANPVNLSEDSKIDYLEAVRLNPAILSRLRPETVAELGLV